MRGPGGRDDTKKRGTCKRRRCVDWINLGTLLPRAHTRTKTLLPASSTRATCHAWCVAPRAAPQRDSLDRLCPTACVVRGMYAYPLYNKRPRQHSVAEAPFCFYPSRHPDRRYSIPLPVFRVEMQPMPSPVLYQALSATRCASARLSAHAWEVPERQLPFAKKKKTFLPVSPPMGGPSAEGVISVCWLRLHCPNFCLYPRKRGEGRPQRVSLFRGNRRWVLWLPLYYGVKRADIGNLGCYTFRAGL